MAVTLADYRTSLRQKLHDNADVLYPISDKDVWINDGLFVRDWLTGGKRQQLTVAANITTDTYTYADLGVGTASILDIIGVYIIDGALRVPLAQLSLTRLNRVGRWSTTFKSRPSAWAWVGQTIIFDCICSTTAFSIQTDCTTTTAPLTLSTDADDLPKPWTDPVAWYAAHLAKINARRLGEAKWFHEKFRESAALIPGARVGMLPQSWGGRPV